MTVLLIFGALILLPIICTARRVGWKPKFETEDKVLAFLIVFAVFIAAILVRI